MNSEVDRLFRKLENDLAENVDRQYFQEPREFRSLIEVLAVLNEQVDQMNRHKELGNDLTTVLKDDTNSHSKLHNQLEIAKRTIEEIVSFQQGGLNNSLDTMSEVVKEYNRGREEIQTLRKSLEETQTVLTAKKSGQISLKELWAKRVELKESLRMVRELEELKNFPLKANRLIQQRRYLTTSKQLKEMIGRVFSEDFTSVGGLVTVREQLFTLKEKLLETSIDELKESIVHFHSSHMIEHTFEDVASLSDDEVGSEANGSVRSYSFHHHYASANNAAAASHHNLTNNDDTASAVSNSRRPSFATGPNNTASSPYSVTSLFYSNMSNNSDYWSYNLKDVDEGLESSLLDPSASGPLFIRLLVKAMSHLGFEEDVEQLLDETILIGFKQNILPRVKSAAMNKLSRSLQQQQQQQSSSSTSQSHSQASFAGGSPLQQDESLRLHSKLFNEYVYLLLEMILGIFQRTIYVYKLLSYSKAMTMTRQTQQSQSNSQSQSQSEYLSSETQRRILTRLTGIILQTEEFVQKEMEIHLVEADVMNISDTHSHSHSHSNNNSSKNHPEAEGGDNNNNNEEEEGEGGLGSLQGKPIYRSSVWHAAFLYSNIFKYNFKLYKLLADNFDEEAILTVMMTGSSGAMSMSMSAEYDDNHHNNGSRQSAVHLLNSSSNKSNNKQQQQQQQQMAITSFTSSLLPFIRKVIESEFIPVVQSWVNTELRDLSEALSIDQLSTATAISMIDQRHKLFHARSQTKQQTKGKHQTNDAMHQMTITNALSTMMIHIVLSTCQLLLKLWYQLFDHRDFLSVVYDRLLKTVNSIIEENQEYLVSSFNVITYLAKISFQPFLVKDWNYNYHKQRAMAGNYQGLVEVFNKIQMNLSTSDSLLAPQYPAFHTTNNNNNNSNNNPNNNSQSNNSNGMNSGSGRLIDGIAHNHNNNANSNSNNNNVSSAQAMEQQQELHQVYIEEFATLQRAFKELQGLPLPKFQPDQNMIGVLGIFSHDSDWLVRKLLSLTLQTVKKGNSISNIYLNSSSNSNSNNNNNNPQQQQSSAKMQSFKNIRHNLLESKKTLITTTLENLQVMQRHAETSLSMLRKVLQILSFYQVNGLVSAFYDFILHPNKASFSEEGTVNIFLTPISNLIEIQAEILSTILLISIIGPIITTLPRIFLRGIISPFLSGQVSSILSASSSSSSDSSGNSNNSSSNRIGLIKACLLRLAVTMQQQLLILIQSVMDKEADSRRKIVDICSEEFERIRRYIAMIDTPASEIQSFIDSEGRDFMEDEFKALRMLCSRQQN